MSKKRDEEARLEAQRREIEEKHQEALQKKRLWSNVYGKMLKQK
jgi:hypothetical protein